MFGCHWGRYKSQVGYTAEEQLQLIGLALGRLGVIKRKQSDLEKRPALPDAGPAAGAL